MSALTEWLNVIGVPRESLDMWGTDGSLVWERKPVALQFSGGKDSLACLYLLKPLVLAGMPVYWTGTGDTMPETLEVVNRERAWIPNFREIKSDVLAWKAENGIPSDITTAQTTFIGSRYGMSDLRMVGRFECCWANLMKPMHDRMVADGIGAVIRGTKMTDTGKVPAVGPSKPYDVVLPLMHWTHDEVFAFLKRQGVTVSTVYDFFKNISAPECLHCTAWWDDGSGALLRKRHPEVAKEYGAQLKRIRAEVLKRMTDLDTEIESVDGLA